MNGKSNGNRGNNTILSTHSIGLEAYGNNRIRLFSLNGNGGNGAAHVHEGVKQSFSLGNPPTLRLGQDQLECFRALKHDGTLSCERLHTKMDFYPNSIVHVISTDSKQERYTCYDAKNNVLRLLKPAGAEKYINEVRPKFSLNPRQAAALHGLLVNDAVIYAALTGPAGTGKTLIALLGGIMQLDVKYQQVVVIRPTVVKGEALGALPGNLHQKQLPYMQPIKDNESFLIQNCDGLKKEYWRIGENGPEINWPYLVTGTPTFYRGCTLAHAYIIVDEAQNCTKEDVHMIGTRLGPGSKMVFVGDLSPSQIDHPHLSGERNGLREVCTRMPGSEIFGSLELNEIMRNSAIADFVARMDI